MPHAGGDSAKALAEVALSALDRTFHIRSGWPVKSGDDKNKNAAKPKMLSKEKKKGKILRKSSTKR